MLKAEAEGDAMDEAEWEWSRPMTWGDIAGALWRPISAAAVMAVVLLGLGIVTGVSRTSRAGRDVTVVNNDDRL